MEGSKLPLLLISSLPSLFKNGGGKLPHSKKRILCVHPGPLMGAASELVNAYAFYVGISWAVASSLTIRRRQPFCWKVGHSSGMWKETAIMKKSGLTEYVVRAQNGDWEAFDTIVRQLQDMAVGYGLSLLGDYHSAQDAAQDAFVEAYRDITALRAPEAFVGWFRRIVFKHCDRQTRGKQARLMPLEVAEQLPSTVPDPAEVAQQQAMATEVWKAIASLPATEREVVLLFYLGAYSHREIAAFLEIPLTTVKSRLYASRTRLKERMLDMVKDHLQEARPSKDSEFLARVNETIAK